MLRNDCTLKSLLRNTKLVASVGDQVAAVWKRRDRRAVGPVAADLPGARRREFAEVIVAAAGRKRLGIQIQRQIRLERVVEPDPGRVRRAIDVPEDIAAAVGATPPPAIVLTYCCVPT